MSSVQVHILLVHVRQKGNDDNDDKFRENAILKNQGGNLKRYFHLRCALKKLTKLILTTYEAIQCFSSKLGIQTVEL